MLGLFGGREKRKEGLVRGRGRELEDDLNGGSAANRKKAISGLQPEEEGGGCSMGRHRNYNPRGARDRREGGGQRKDLLVIGCAGGGKGKIILKLEKKFSVEKLEGGRTSGLLWDGK